jgi:hypothetical protein
MKFRTSPLLAVAALLAVSAAAPAMAGDFDMGGIPVVRARPVVAGSSNSLDATNVAAGVGNTADQDIDAKQAGGFGRFSQPIRRRGGGGRVMPQGVPGPGIGLGAVTNNLSALNLAAGIDNQASQTIHSKQK